MQFRVRPASVFVGTRAACSSDGSSGVTVVFSHAPYVRGGIPALHQTGDDPQSRNALFRGGWDLRKVPCQGTLACASVTVMRVHHQTVSDTDPAGGARSCARCSLRRPREVTRYYPQPHWTGLEATETEMRGMGRPPVPLVARAAGSMRNVTDAAALAALKRTEIGLSLLVRLRVLSGLLLFCCHVVAT